MSALLAQAGGTANTAEVVLFCVFAVIALGAGIAMVSMRNIVHAALMLVVNFLSVAALFLGLQSSFLAIGQVIVYAGAIMVLFLFVIMLLGVDRDDLLVGGARRTQVLAVLGCALVAGVLLFGFAGTYTGAESRCGSQAPADVARTADTQPCVGLDAALEEGGGAVGVLADRMFGRYTFPFELAAVLLTVATVGAMVLGKRVDLHQDDDPAWASTVPPPDDEDLERRLALEAEGEPSLGAMQHASLTRDDDADALVTDDPEVAEAQRRRDAGTDEPDDEGSA